MPSHDLPISNTAYHNPLASIKQRSRLNHPATINTNWTTLKQIYGRVTNWSNPVSSNQSNPQRQTRSGGSAVRAFGGQSYIFWWVRWAGDSNERNRESDGFCLSRLTEKRNSTVCKNPHVTLIFCHLPLFAKILKEANLICENIQSIPSPWA